MAPVNGRVVDGAFVATCHRPGCAHRSTSPDCEITEAWSRWVVASVSEGHCPWGHGRLEPLEDGDPRDVNRDADRLATGWCAPCGWQWTTGEDWWAMDRNPPRAWLPPW